MTSTDRPCRHAETLQGCGICAKYDRDPAFRDHCTRRAAAGLPPSQTGRPVAAYPPAARGTPGVGHHLKALLAELGLTGSAGCGCDDQAAQLDVWGLDGCRRRREQVLDRLRAKAREVGWAAKVAAGARALAGGLVLNPLDPAAGLFEEALRRTEAAIAAAARGPAGEYLTVPEPPPLALRPTSSRAVVTVVVGPEAEALHRAGGPHMARYAARVGADFVVLRWPGLAAWPMSSKFGLWSALALYERVVHADADVLFRPAAVDLFALTAPGRMGVYDERPFHQHRVDHFDVEPSYDRWRARMGYAEPRPVCYFNAGVMVIPQSHREIFAPPARLWVEDAGTGRHCAEQHLLNSRLWGSGLPYQLLDRRANWEGWIYHGLADAPPDAVLHWSGGPERHRRAERMAALAARYPWPAP